MSDKGFTVSGVKEISRGKDWVKFLVSFSGSGIIPASYFSIKNMHDTWVLDGQASGFGCGIAEVMRFNFDDSKAVFKFATEPYSMKSNDCYRYIDAFGKWDGNPAKRGPGVSANPGVSEASGTTSAGEKPVFDAKSVVDDLLDGMKNIRIAGIDFGKPEKDLVIDMAPYAGKFVRSDGVNVPSCRTVGEFRTTNDVRVKSLISRLKAK